MRSFPRVQRTFGSRAPAPTNSLLSLTLRNRGSYFGQLPSFEPCRLHEPDQLTSSTSRRSYRSSSPEGTTNSSGSTTGTRSSSERYGRRRKDHSSSREGNSHGDYRRPRKERRSRNYPPLIPPPGSPGRGCHKDLMTPGLDVWVLPRSGEETPGVVESVLTNSSYHPRGIKVRLKSGKVGRVTRIASDE